MKDNALLQADASDAHDSLPRSCPPLGRKYHLSNDISGWQLKKQESGGLWRTQGSSVEAHGAPR